jgi:Flp pilus assembly protein TadD
MSSEPRANLIARARQLIRLHRPEQAAALLGQAIAAKPDDVVPHQMLAQCLIQMNRNAEALKEANNAISLAPESDWSFRLRSIALLALGEGPGLASGPVGRRKRRQGLEAAQEAVRLAPMEPLAFRQLALGYLANNNPWEAVTAAERAVQLSPTSADSLNVLGLAALRAGRIEGANAAFRKALQLNPNHAAALNNLGLIAQVEGRPKEAPEMFGASVRANPRLTVGAQNAARASNVMIRHALVTGFLVFVLFGLRAVGSTEESGMWWIVAIASGGLAYLCLRIWRAVRDTYRPRLLEFTRGDDGRLVHILIMLVGAGLGALAVGSPLGCFVALWPFPMWAVHRIRFRARKAQGSRAHPLERVIVIGGLMVLSIGSCVLSFFVALPAFVQASPGQESGPLIGFAVSLLFGLLFAVATWGAIRALRWHRRGGAPLLDQMVAEPGGDSGTSAPEG